MTKVEVEKLFKEEFSNLLKGTDKPAKKTAWNNFTDELMKDGEITEKQCDTWDHPKFIK